MAEGYGDAWDFRKGKRSSETCRGNGKIFRPEEATGATVKGTLCSVSSENFEIFPSQVCPEPLVKDASSNKGRTTERYERVTKLTR